MKKEIVYFDEAGKQNTDECISAVKKRVSEGDIKHVIVASSTGSTALKLCDALSGVKIICVSYHAGVKTKEIDGNTPKIEAKGGVVFAGIHALSGVERSVAKKHNGVYPALLIADAYKKISQGFKVAVEIMLAATDASLVPRGEDVIAIGGSHYGADTAIVVKTCIAGELLQEMNVKEIICMPK